MAAISAGILLFRLAGEAVEVLLVHPGGPYWAKKDLGAWSIPKGLVEQGEEPLQCALRELEEELGSPFSFAEEELIELGSVRQKAGKVVHGWAAEGDFDPTTLRSNTFSLEWPPRSGSEREFPEVDRAEWFGLEQAGRKIVAAQAEFLDRLKSQMSAQVESEPLNKAGFASFAERAADGKPLVMLNLLAFKPDGGRQRYEEYGEAVAPLLEKAGGRIAFIGESAAALIGDGSWDLVVLVEYPTRQAFLDMIGSAEYQAVGHLRTEALTKGELHPVDPGEGTP